MSENVDTTAAVNNAALRKLGSNEVAGAPQAQAKRPSKTVLQFEPRDALTLQCACWGHVGGCQQRLKQQMTCRVLTSHQSLCSHCSVQLTKPPSLSATPAPKAMTTYRAYMGAHCAVRGVAPVA